MNVYFAGWWHLLRLNLRRDRWQLFFWVLGITGLSVLVAGAFPRLFPTSQERQLLAETVKNPAMIAMIGPSSSLDNYTLGAMFGHEMTLFMAMTSAVMGIMLTASHTRGDEEEGQLEMLRALAVGRLAPLSAVLVEILLISLLLALTNGIGIGLLGVDTMPMSSTLLYGAALGAALLVFAGAAALIAQFVETKRGTVAGALAFLGVSYLFRGFTDLSQPRLSWLSPLSWVYKTEVFVKDTWLPIFLSLLCAVFLFGACFFLNSIRDLGIAFIPQRRGRDSAGPLLKTSLGLSVRLIKTTLLSWLLVLFVAGASYGSFFGDLENFFESNEMLALLLPKDSGYSLTEQFMTVLMVILSILSTIPVVSILLRVYGEEKRGRVEQLLSKALTKRKLIGGYYVFAFLTAPAMLLCAVAGLYVASSRVMTTPISLSVMLTSSFVYLPAMWLVLALALLLVAYRPQWSSLIWGYLAFSFFVNYLGNLLNVPEVIQHLSVFSYIPRIPVETVDWLPLLLLSGSAAVLTVLGFYGYQKRDILN